MTPANGDGKHVVGAPYRGLAIARVAGQTATLLIEWSARRDGNMADGERRWIVTRKVSRTGWTRCARRS